MGGKPMTVTFRAHDAEIAKVAQLPVHRSALATGLYANHGKRLLDLVIVTLSLPIVLPVLLLCALANLVTGNAVFYTQLRLGRHGKIFRIWKLRTMDPRAEEMLQEILQDDPARREEWLTTQKLKDDPRITRVGAFLRRTSLDEIPQLFNVLRGDMSLLGPRPMMLDQVEIYGPSLPIYLSLRPGVSGKWQVSERNDAHFRRRAQIDAEYARDLSLRTDLLLIWQTLRTLIRSTGY
jgi:lipopolysaccharide/colanic/teichoic acid biosynthesis glycosyltransferase